MKFQFDCKFNFNGRIALVTGGGSGIGAAVVAALIKAGAKVAVMNRDEEKLKKIPEDCVPVRCDIGDGGAVEKAVAGLVSRLGTPHFLVNSVGLNIRKPVFDLTEEELGEMFRTNFFGTFRLCRIIAKFMASEWKPGEPYRKIVNIASTGAWQGSPGYGGYNSTKAALVNATRVMANEWYKKGIIVNSVCPGPVKTAFLPYLDDAGRVKSISDKTPAGRLGEPGDIAGPVMFLLSNMSDWVVGQALTTDGGKGLNG
jgi:NAD(P)-dependent dehydrogenase (short-subunit alcohol dehydrogenase family)